MVTILRPNQLKAITTTIDNNFKTGVHYHVTGSGKSWIAMNIILSFNKLNPKAHIIWICEKKSILIEQFNKDNLKSRNFYHIHQTFNIINFTENKLDDWYDSVNSSSFFWKPVLLIINRAFLTSSEKYKKIKINFGLLIHDECHTIVNKTTKAFYEHILNKKGEVIKCIGFSATPNLNFEPYKEIITSYNIYDAFLDDVIVPPKIKWFSCNDLLDYKEIMILIKDQIEKVELPYNKIIVWCGMIHLCSDMAKLFSQEFKNYLICIDTHKKIDGYKGYEEFSEIDTQAILFCAAKHREGSDIKNLDCCVFLDKVENRCPKVFIQCIGRVLRKDKLNLKKFGLVIDVRAKSPLLICNNFNEYMQLDSSLPLPWSYNYEVKVIEENEKIIKINQLDMIKVVENEDNDDNKLRLIIEEKCYTIEELKKLFIREIPNQDIYLKRLNFELEMLQKKNLIYYLMQAIHILNLTKSIPHVTRGSCGSSLVCYMLGISHIDPVKNNIKFARFLTEYRNNLPDIDLDFPNNLRDEVFLKIGLTWPGKVARISNHVYYHDKSALRQAIRNQGIHKFIGKNEIDKEIKKLDKDVQKAIMKEKEKLEDTFKGYSLHCGGIVYYPEGIPKELLFKGGSGGSGGGGGLIKQITMNKYDIAKEKNFKIDILSSRALSQCYECFKYNMIKFEEFTYDQLTFNMLCSGDNIGIILGESPLIRKAFILVKPKNIHDLGVCLSIIRPAAKDAKQSTDIENYDGNIIFDDDAIDLIASYLEIDDEKADKYRRAFAKGDKVGISEFKRLLESRYSKEEQRKIMGRLSNLARYGFCKSHAFSYGQLIWKLAYMKANHPKDFWKATLNNCVSMYKKWVHYYEAHLAGVDLSKELLKRHDVSIYASNRRKKIEGLNIYEQLRKYGYWIINQEGDFFPGCYIRLNRSQDEDRDQDQDQDQDEYHFNGIIAATKILKSKKNKKMVLFIGVGKKKYIEVVIENIKYFNNKNIGIEGIGKPKNNKDKICSVITATTYRLW